MISNEYCLVAAHRTVGTEAAYIGECPGRRIADRYAGTCLTVVGAFHMRPHDEFLCLFVVNHFGTFQHLAGVQVVFLVIFHGRKYNTLELPVQQVFRRVAADTGYVGAVAFPRSPFGQDGFPFFVFAIPIVGPFVVKKAAAMGVDGIAVGVFPYFPGYACGIFRYRCSFLNKNQEH